MSSFCPDCGTQLKPEWKVCPGCARSLNAHEAQYRCLRCNKVGDTPFCPDCGEKMVEIVPVDDAAHSMNVKQRVFGGVAVGAVLCMVLSFFMALISNGYDSFTSMKLFTILDIDRNNQNFYFLVFQLLCLLLTLTALGFAVGAMFKRRFFLVTSILSATALVCRILTPIVVGLRMEWLGFGFYFFVLASVVCAVFSCIGFVKAKRSC